MQLNDVQDALKPAIDLIFQKRLTYHEADHTFKLEMVRQAMRENNNVYYRAAMQLRVSTSWVKQMWEGYTPKPRGQKNAIRAAEETSK